MKEYLTAPTSTLQSLILPNLPQRLLRQRRSPVPPLLPPTIIPVLILRPQSMNVILPIVMIPQPVVVHHEILPLALALDVFSVFLLGERFVNVVGIGELEVVKVGFGAVRDLVVVVVVVIVEASESGVTGGFEGGECCFSVGFA